MIGVGENDFGAEFLERLLCQGLNAGRSPYRHEKSRVNHAVRRCKRAAARANRVSLLNDKGKLHVPRLPQSAAFFLWPRWRCVSYFLAAAACFAALNCSAADSQF